MQLCSGRSLDRPLLKGSGRLSDMERESSLVPGTQIAPAFTTACKTQTTCGPHPPGFALGVLFSLFLVDSLFQFKQFFFSGKKSVKVAQVPGVGRRPPSEADRQLQHISTNPLEPLRGSPVAEA